MVSASDLQEVEALEQEIAPIAGKEGGNAKSKSLYLELVRKHKLRKSELVAKYGLDLLNSRSSRRWLGNDVWTVYEQVAIAALDCGDLTAAKECIGSLMKRFPGSMRVGRLEGMWLEASGRWEEADRVYSNLLEEHPVEASLHKRKIAVVKGKGNLIAMVEALTKYLESFMADYDAWRELADTYIKLQMYKQAAFCYEELLLVSPLNPIYNLTYAELLYTVGGVENFKTSKKYYAAAIEFSGGKNVRALYGIALCSSALSKAVRSTRGQKEEKESSALPELAVQVIEKEYRQKNPEKLELVVNFLNKLNI